MATILLVEDEIVISLYTSMVLEDAGYTVYCAANGEAGLVKVVETQPDLIVTDYMMPRMDGMAMIRELRTSGVTVPIVLATSISEDIFKKEEDRGYDAYIGKPYRESSLLGIVQSLLKVQ